MKKLLTVTLVFVFSLALVLALGCTKKEEAAEPGAEQGVEPGMEQTMPPEEGATVADTAAVAPEAPAAEGGAAGQ